MWTEKMNDLFTKHHLNHEGQHPWPFRPVLHHFTGPDDGLPHDHPHGFTSYVLKSSYIEEVYILFPDGQHAVTRSVCTEGTAHHVSADCIHRIIELPEGECWTMVIAGPNERQPRFWDFSGDIIKSRQWDSDVFEPLSANF